MDTRIYFILLILGLVACSETVEVSLQTKKQLIDKGLISRGWVPGWIPESATDIREAHKIDSNETIFVLSYQQSEKVTLPGTCKRAEPKSLPRPHLKKWWWPRDFSSDYNRLLFFSCGEEMYVACGNGVFYFWRTSANSNSTAPAGTSVLAACP